MGQTWVSLLNEGQTSQLSTGTAYASSTTATDVSAGGNTAGQAFTFPASYLQLGMQFRVRANGIVSNTGTPTLKLGLYYGGVAGVSLADTGTATTVTSLANNTWILDALMRVDAVGPSGSIRTIGSVVGPYSAVTLIPATSSSGNNVTVDTSTSKILTIGATWGTNSASNTLTCMQVTIEKLNEGNV